MSETTTEKKPPRKQCAKCPWKVGVTPHDIPNGYSRKRHADLKNTIADPGSFYGRGGVKMACHETARGEELPCVGWLVNQVGEGNNIGLRIQAMTGQVDANVETVGEQHVRFEDTLPKGRKRAARRLPVTS